MQNAGMQDNRYDSAMLTDASDSESINETFGDLVTPPSDSTKVFSPGKLIALRSHKVQDQLKSLKRRLNAILRDQKQLDSLSSETQSILTDSECDD